VLDDAFPLPPGGYFLANSAALSFTAAGIMTAVKMWSQSWLHDQIFSQ
jgi:hypothetical protein